MSFWTKAGLFFRRILPLLLNVRVWLPVLGVIVTACMADGLIGNTGRLHDFAVTFLDVLGRLGLYGVAGAVGLGIVSAAAYERPRKTLAEMTDAEREDLFKKYPDVRARWEAQLLQTPRAGDILDGGKK